MNTKSIILIILAGCLVLSCSPAEEHSQSHTNFTAGDHLEISLKGHTCSYCDQTIQNNRFGGLITGNEDENLYFGSVECLAGYVLKSSALTENSQNVFVADFHAGERVVPAENARYIRTDLLNSPNGLRLLAYTGKKQLDDSFKVAYGGEHKTWQEVLQYVSIEWDIAQK